MPHFAFSSINPSYTREIITDAYISMPSKNVGLGNGQLVKVLALWDTGATNSVVTPHIISQLGLKPDGVAQSTHAGGVSLVNTYLVDIALPNKILLPGVRVSECAEQNGRFDIIVGMDIISLGDFSVTGPANRRMVSFCAPTAMNIDYVLFLKQLNQQAAMMMQANTPEGLAQEKE